MELNVLAHLNRLFDATFKLPNFAYRPIYNQMCDRVEARLVSLCSQRVQFPKLHTRLQLREGDVLRTDVMRKFPRSSLEKTFEGAGCTITRRSEEHTSELQSLMRISYAVFCLKKKQ